jgi:glycosyltransferase involved in cell wall biosynthesis
MKYPVSLITSMFNASEFIDSFMDNILSQTIFKKCELFIVDANPKSEKHLIKNYLDYENIIYTHISDFGLTKDPGVYGCWNLAVKNCSGKYITNTNLDDRRSSDAIEKQYLMLEQMSFIDLVYYRTLVTQKPNETVEKNSSDGEFPCIEFSFQNLLKVNSPHCQPMWRKSIHDRFGYFNETLKYAADYDMWLRAAHDGAKMLRINEVLGLYYRNPKGISSNEENLADAIAEVNILKMQYLENGCLKN